MTNISEIISDFTPISLEEMDHVKLLDRIDTKYVLHEAQLADFLPAVAAHYKLLVIGNESLHPYETLYFDTPGFHLYQMHHNGKRNRYKLRCRKYINSGTAFFEVKLKTNTRRTIKKRIQIEGIQETLDGTLNKYIKENTKGTHTNFVPVLRVFFDRLTLVNIDGNERLTVDVNLRYSANGSTREIKDMAIVEVKQQKHSVSPFRQLMRKKRQSRNYLSKYCLGVTSLNSGLKKNRFKEKFRELKKLGYDI